MPSLGLRFLGPPRIEIDASPVALKRRKPLALLAYLAITSQRIPRDTLAELLYPGQDRDHAFSSLRQSLYLLRAAVGDEWLAVDQDGVELVENPALWIDARELRRLSVEATSAQRSGDSERCLERLSAAAGLFRGEFLSGFGLRDSSGFEQWQQEQEEGFRRQRTVLLGKLVDILEERGELKQAIAQARTWLAVDPLAEEAHRRLMLLHAVAGERAAALRQYERCRAILAAELREKPELETEQLRERIAQGRITAAPARTGPATAHRGVVACPDAALLSGDVASDAAPATVPKGAVTVACAPRERLKQSYSSVAMAVAAALDNSEPSSTSAAIHSGAFPERADLLLDLASPGQVLVSGPAAERLGGPPPRGASLRSLGIHRLKDLGPALEVFQLHHPMLPSGHPTLQSLDSRPNNLPTQTTVFVGRQKELAAVVEALRSEDVRLLTLTGTGGTGKTRLALQAAAAALSRFEHGAFFVDLAPLRDPALVLKAVADTLEVRASRGDTRTVAERLSAWLRARSMLLVLDNFEHLMPAAGDVAGLLAAAPRLSVMVTSVEPLRISAEHELMVPPLEVPTRGMDWTAIRDCPAVALFAQSAARRRAGFAVDESNAGEVAAICARLDGLPLALELAAARLDVLTPRALLERLDARLEVLTGGPRDRAYRQQVLRREIDWTHDLLDARSRQAFRRLAVFPGGFGLDAALAVCGGELEALSDLVGKSLVVRKEHGGEPGYRLLQVIREYAGEKLSESDDGEPAREALAFHFLAAAEKLAREAIGPGWKTVWASVRREGESFREALRWFLDSRREEGLRLAAAISWTLRSGGTPDERDTRPWLEQFYPWALSAPASTAAARIAVSLGWVRYHTGSSDLPLPESGECFEEGIRIARACGDLSELAQALVSRGWAGADLPCAKRSALASESIQAARASGDPWTLSWCLLMVATGRDWNGRDGEACRKDMEESLLLAERLDYLPYLAVVVNAFGRFYKFAGRLAEAEPWFVRADGMTSQVYGTSITFYAGDLPELYLMMHQPEKARPLLRKVLAAALDSGFPKVIWKTTLDYAFLACQEGKIQRAARLFAAVSAELARAGASAEDPVAWLSPWLRGIVDKEWHAGPVMGLDQAAAYVKEDW